MISMEIIQINANNIDQEHICCAIGNDKENRLRAETKKNWLKRRFDDGLIFKRLNARGKVFVEYMPIETVWKPIIGQNYMAINCLWVSGQFKGNGYSRQLLAACISDTKSQGKNGIVVVTSSEVKPFLTDKKFYLKHGFKTIDTSPPYFELLALSFNPEAPLPRFADHVKTSSSHAHSKGFTFVYSNQCPFMQDFGGKIYPELARKYGFETQSIHLKTADEAREMGSPFGTFGAWLNGQFMFHDLMTETKFEQLLISLKTQ